MTGDDRIDPDVLAAYETPAPAPDLGARFAQRLAAQPPAPRNWRPYALAATAIVVAAAAVVLLLVRPADAPATGASTPTARTTEQIGSRGVAVVEAGAAITWTGDDVHQDRGDVFYRVEPGSTFAVTTPVATITVHGTCFRIDLEPTGAVVTVYEGRVDVANTLGTLALAAGDRALATADAAPRPLTASRVVAATQLTIPELLARDGAQRQRIAELEAKLATRPAVEAIGPVQHMKRPFEMTQPELAELATRCQLPLDVPPTAGSTLMDQILAQGERDTNLTDAERAAVSRAIAAFQPQYQNELEQLYRDLTGEPSALDPLTLILEITQKSPAADIATTYQRVSAERAGLRTAERTGTVIDRYVRFALASADAFEKQLAHEIGAERAHAFRRTWGMVNLDPGCPSKEGHP